MAYNSSNSLSPMIFKKKGKGESGGSRNERYRSKSVENIADTENFSSLQKAHRAGKVSPDSCGINEWKDLHSLKSNQPLVVCVLPSLSIDYVASAVLAVGATPLITEGTY